MGIAFSVINAKGGVGKTTTAVNVAAMAASAPKADGTRRRVLVCDLDPQMNATQQCGYIDIDPSRTLAGHVTREGELEPIIIHNAAAIEGLDLLPAHYQLSYTDEGILATGTWLRRKLGLIRSRYDLIIFDCPVYLGALTRNALAASDGIVIPTQAEKHSVTGLPHLIARAKQVFEESECIQPWAYILVTMFSQRNSIEQRWSHEVRQQYPGIVLRTVIRRNTDLAKSATGGLPIVAYDDKCAGYEDYKAVTEELLTLFDQTQPQLHLVKNANAVTG